MECNQPKGIKPKMRGLKLINGVFGHGALNPKDINQGYLYGIKCVLTLDGSCLHCGSLSQNNRENFFYCVPEHDSYCIGANICWEFFLASQPILLHRRVAQVLTSSF